jgi:hypothetical protein
MVPEDAGGYRTTAALAIPVQHARAVLSFCTTADQCLISKCFGGAVLFGLLLRCIGSLCKAGDCPKPLSRFIHERLPLHGYPNI